MGEYAKHLDREIKIGTCEDMYYLRACDRHSVTPLPHSLDAADPELLPQLRWRFPFPDEDAAAPGPGEGDYDRGDRVPGDGEGLLEGVEHHTIQTSHPMGLLAGVPCPNDPKQIEGIQLHKNGWRGDVFLVQQKFVKGQYWAVCRCCCGALFRLDPQAGTNLAQRYLDRAQCEIDEEQPESADQSIEMATRILAGYRGECDPRLIDREKPAVEGAKR